MWLATFLLAAAIGSLWSVATPLFNAPDEPAHAIRAASVARLDIVGDEVPKYEDKLVVEAPKAYGDASDSISCYVFGRNTPTNCATFDDHTQLVRLPTSAGRHPPAYYFVAGLPSLVFRGAFGVYLMRMVSIFITSAFVASAVVTIAHLARPRLGGLAILLSATPMFFFVGAVVNPSALEIPAALLLWVAGTVLAVEAPTRIDPRVLRRVGVAAILLVLSRQLSPLWLLIIALALLALGGVAAARALWASRAARWWGAAIVAATLLQSLWIVVVRPLDPSLGDSEGIRGLGHGTALRTSFGETLNRLREMVGWFGWLDAPSPGVTYALWLFAFTILVGVALVAWRRRFLVVALAVAVVTIATPLGLETIQARRIGFFWQGRYSMPLALGVPVLLALSLAIDRGDEADAADGVWRSHGIDRLVGSITIAVVVAHVAAYGQALRRSTVGYDGPLDFLLHPVWSPPFPAWLLVALYVALLATFALWVTHTADAAAQPRAQRDAIPSGSLRYS